METENKTRPAFPCSANPGLTKLEYAMIHCNEPVPEWFKTEMPKRPVHPGYMDSVFGKNSNHPNKDFYMKHYNDENDEWNPSVDVLTSLYLEVKRHVIKLTKWYNKDQKWIDEERKQRMVQWRRYFAENILLKEEQ